MQETNEMTDSLNKERESVRKQVEKLFFFFLRKDKLFISVYKSTIYIKINEFKLEKKKKKRIPSIQKKRTLKHQ